MKQPVESTCYLFHNGTRLKIKAIVDPDTLQVTQEVFEIESNKKKRKQTSEDDNNLKKLKIYHQADFKPLQHELLLNQKDLFSCIVSFIDMSTTVHSLRLVCKTWDDWLVNSFNNIWKERYLTYFRQFTEDTFNSNSTKSYLLPLCILESAREKHSECSDGEKDVNEDDYELMQNEEAVQLIADLQCFFFLEKLESSYEFHGKDSLTKVSAQVLLANVKGDPSFVRFFLDFTRSLPKYGEGSAKIEITGRIVLDGEYEEADMDLYSIFDSFYGNAKPEWKHKHILKCMKAVGLDRTGTDFNVFIACVFDFVLKRCDNLHTYNYSHANFGFK